MREAARAAARPGGAVGGSQPIAHASGAGWIPDDRGRKTFPEGGWQELRWHFLPCGNACDDGSGIARVVRVSDAPEAWRNLIQLGRPGGRGVKVAAVDTGVAYRDRGKKFARSPDLKRRQFKAARDFVDRDKVALDENGHGTHVASTIGERTDGNEFVTGLAYGAKLIPVRVLDESGSGKASQVAKGIRWAYRHGADVINLSLEFPRGAVKECADVPSVCAAIAEAHAKGAVVVAAAGNPGGPRSIVAYPALAPHVIATGGTTERACLGNYSNWGFGLDVVAPGSGRDMAMAGPQCDPAAEGGHQPAHAAQGIERLRQLRLSTLQGHLDGVRPRRRRRGARVAALEERLGREPTPRRWSSGSSRPRAPSAACATASVYGAGLVDAGAATAR